VHITSIWPQVEDRVADDLTRTVVRHVTSAAGLVDGDPEFAKPLARSDDVGARNLASNPERDDGRVFEEEQQIRNSVRTPLLDPFPLKCQRLVVTDAAQPPDFQLAHVT
jgi:hypothetical protein